MCVCVCASVYVCKLADGEQPLFLRLVAGPDTDTLSFVLREQQTGEVMVRPHVYLHLFSLSLILSALPHPHPLPDVTSSQSSLPLFFTFPTFVSACEQQLASPFSGMRSPSLNYVTSCGSLTKRRTSSERRWFAATRPTARDCRRRWGRSERLLRAFTSSKQDCCPLQERKRCFIFFPLEAINCKFFWRGEWTQSPSSGRKDDTDRKRDDLKKRRGERINSTSRGMRAFAQPAFKASDCCLQCSDQRFRWLCHIHSPLLPLHFLFLSFKLVKNSMCWVTDLFNLFYRSVHIFSYLYWWSSFNFVFLKDKSLIIVLRWSSNLAVDTEPSSPRWDTSGWRVSRKCCREGTEK